MKIREELKNILQEEYKKDLSGQNLNPLQNAILSDANTKKPQKRFLPNFAQLKKYFLYPAVAFALILVAITTITKPAIDKPPKQATKIESPKFAHFQYLPKPQFGNTAPSSLAASSEYRVKGTLPSAEKLLNVSKTSLLPIAYAASPVSLPVYRAHKQEVTQEVAVNLAKAFNISGEPKQDPSRPALYTFVWDNNEEYFEVYGTPTLGSYTYYLKGPGLPGDAPSDEDAGRIAREFLTEKGVIDDTYFIAGIQHNLSDNSKRVGFREDHKEVYFRKKLEGFQVYDWIAGGGSPTTDKQKVWVGVGGRILYAFNEGQWTTADPESKKDYVLKEPTAVVEDLKAGMGKLAWLDYDAVGISTSGVGPSAPSGNFVQNGRLREVEIQSVELAYYHQPEAPETPEFYQPIYVFKAQATLDWKDDYVVDYEADKLIQGKRTEVVLVVSAISEDYFFNNTVTLTEGQTTRQISSPPVYYPETNENKGSFLLKLGTVTPLEDPKQNVYLSWEDVNNTTKYNILLNPAGDKEYSQQGSVDGSKLSETIGVNKYIDYHIKIQACGTSGCVESNELFLPQDQKPTFYLKLGTVTHREDPKTEVYLSWPEYPGTEKYNIYLRNSKTERYETALEGIGGLSYTATVNRHNDNYFIIQACNNEACYPSNEIFIPKE